MKVQTSLTYEDLAKALGLHYGTVIDLVEDLYLLHSIYFPNCSNPYNFDEESG